MKKLIHVLDKDKRKRKRVELFSNIPATIEALGKSVPVRIKDVSYGGIGVVIPKELEFQIIESIETKVEVSNQFFQGRVANRIILPNQEIKIGLALPSEGGREIDFNTMDSSWDRVTDSEIIQNIYSDLVLKGFDAPIEIRQNFSSATIYPLKITESGTLICELGLIHQGQIEKGKIKCVFHLFNTCHAFDSNIEKIDDTKIEIKLSSTLARLLRRETVRIQKKNANFDMKIKLFSQDLETTIEEYEVFDYSEHGISMLDPEGNLSLPRNLLFNEATIEIEGFSNILGKAEVRSYQWNRDLSSYIVGLKFQPDEEPHLTNWHNIVLKARYPNLDFNYQESDHQQIWDLFVRSDYLHLKGKEAYAIIIDLTKNTWVKLNNIGTGFSKRAMIRKDDKILGHIQMDQFYPDTWCVHHLAVDPTMSKLIAGELYALTTDVLLSEKGKYLINFTESSKSWNQRSYYDFIKNYRFPEHNELKEFFIYDANVSSIPNIPVSSKLTIKKPNKFDIKKISRFFSEHLSSLEVQACALTEEDIELKKLNSFFSEAGLSRKREFLVCFKDDQLVGIARMEFGSEGINIVGIQDMLYLYSAAKENEGEIIDSLLKKALEVYKNENKEKVILSMENERTEAFKNYGINFVCVANRWIALKDILPRYHAFSQLLYGNLILRREKIRNKNKSNNG